MRDAESTGEELLRLAGQRYPPVDLRQISALWPDLKLKTMPLETATSLIWAITAPRLHNCPRTRVTGCSRQAKLQDEL